MQRVALFGLRWVLTGCAAAVSITAMAPGSLRAAPDAEFGRYLATQCLTCHRSTDVGGVAIPNIFGMPAAKFTSQIKAYRERKLPNEVMQSQAASLKDDEIEALAAYFSRAKRP